MAVHSAEGTTLEVPLAGAVVGQLPVSVLKEGDEDQPVVGKEVRDAVVADHVPERGSMCPGEEGTDGKGQADVRLNNLPKVLLVKHDRGRRKVCRVIVSIRDQIDNQDGRCSAYGWCRRGSASDHWRCG